MEEPVLLFTRRIVEASRSPIYELYFYHDGCFYNKGISEFYEDETLQLNHFLTATKIDFNIFLLIYEETKKEYCIDEFTVDSKIREYNIKKLIN